MWWIVFNFQGLPGRVLRRGASACLLLGALVALGGCAWFDVKQRQLVLRPTPGSAPAGFAGLRPGDLSFATEVPGAERGTRDSLQMWWLPHADPRAPTLLYLHGTFRNLYANLPKIDALRDAGFAVLAVDYRGWGDSTPLIPSETTIYADAHTAWAELTRREPDPRRRVIYGHSMGGGVAVELASRLRHRNDYGALILESTFTSGVDVAGATNWLLGLLARFSSQKFDSLAKIGKVDAPVLMLHGDADRTVPVALGRQLRDAAPAGTRWVEFAGGSHSRLQSDAPAEYRQALKLLIEQLG
jgi:uncharacterized protein